MHRRNLLFAILLSIILCSHAMGETIRLAIVSEPSLLAVSDLLTAELSHKTDLQILERAQIDKVFREQALTIGASSHQNVLKLGQLLGADGVIVLENHINGINSTLNARLIAVKPGVILGSLSGPWPLKNPINWVTVVTGKFTPLWPKLTVLPKDAVPISILNLRSSANSAESVKTEHELTLLLLDRLMLEKEVFILERRKLENVGEEKTLQGIDDAPFWNGSFLLDGVIDKDGFAAKKITIDARLTPRGGSAPLTIAVAGPRNELVKLADDLAKKILTALQKKTSVSEWKPEEEAAQFCTEAEWALKWNMFREAQSAAESAWALGQRDLACADIRVRSYVYEVTKGVSDLSAPANVLDMYPFQPAPDTAKLDEILHALELYYDFSRTLPAGEPQINSTWYFTGVETLDAAGWVLQNFYFAPEARKRAEPKLAELRSLARETVKLIYRSASVRDAYWIGDLVDRNSLPKRDGQDEKFRKEYRGSMTYCKVVWGCFWQETPEECLALYRELLTSDVFTYYNRSLWFRGPHRPRLTAWKTEDQRRIPELWSRFLTEVKTSTNFLHQIEANAFLMTDAKTDRELQGAFNDLFTTLFAHTNDIVKHNCDFHYNWILRELVDTAPVNDDNAFQQRIYVTKDRLRKKFREEYGRRLDSLSRAHIEYLSGLQIPERSNWTDLINIPSLEELPTTNALPVTRFLAISPDQLEEDASRVQVLAHKFRDGKVWLDLQYRTRWRRNEQNDHSAFAAWDIVTQKWRFIKRPDRDAYFVGGRYTSSEEGPHFEIFHDAIYCSDKDQWLKYDLRTERWERLALPGQTLAQFFVIEDRLYATTGESILEITDGGRSSRILASTRRRPSETSLDSLDALSTRMYFPTKRLNPWESRTIRGNSPMLFSGPDHSLRANIGKTIYSFDGKDWSEIWKLPITGIPEVSDDSTTIIRPMDQSTAQVWLLSPNQTNADFGFDQHNTGIHAAPTIEEQKESPKSRNLRPLWTPQNDFPLMAKAASLNSNLYFLIDCAKVYTNSAGEIEINGTVPQMRLACFDRNSANPLIVSIHFDQRQGPTPTGRSSKVAWERDFTSPWMLFAKDQMYIGNRDTSGIWVVSERDLTTAFRKAKQAAKPQ